MQCETAATEEEIISDLSFYKFVISSMPIAVVALTPDLKIVRFNTFAEEITGYSEKEVVGRYCGEILRGGECHNNCPLKTVIKRDQPIVRIDTVIRNKQGDPIPVKMNTAGLFDGAGKLIGGVEAFQDISTLKAFERERSNLIQMFAHDMKSSLSGIHGLGLRLLKTLGLGDKKDRKYLELITQEAAKLEFLVADFLEISRLQTGKLSFNFSATSIDKELYQIFDLYQPRASQQGIKLDLQIARPLPIIEADANRLRRVFINLLDNALKFSEAQTTITIVALEKDDDVVIRITDQGAGIPPQELPYIFDLFHRGPGAIKTDGHGIGLATAKAIMEGHGGRILVTSQLNEGSTFNVILPKEGITEAKVQNQ